MPSHHSLRSDGSVDESALEGGLHAYGGDRVIACAVVFIVMCTVALVLRFYARRVSKCPVSLEDYVLIPTWVLMMAHCANALCGKRTTTASGSRNSFPLTTALRSGRCRIWWRGPP